MIEVALQVLVLIGILGGCIAAIVLCVAVPVATWLSFGQQHEPVPPAPAEESSGRPSLVSILVASNMALLFFGPMLVPLVSALGDEPAEEWRWDLSIVPLVLAPVYFFALRNVRKSTFTMKGAKIWIWILAIIGTVVALAVIAGIDMNSFLAGRGYYPFNSGFMAAIVYVLVLCAPLLLMAAISPTTWPARAGAITATLACCGLAIFGWFQVEGPSTRLPNLADGPVVGLISGHEDRHNGYQARFRPDREGDKGWDGSLLISGPPDNFRSLLNVNQWAEVRVWAEYVPADQLDQGEPRYVTIRVDRIELVE